MASLARWLGAAKALSTQAAAAFSHLLSHPSLPFSCTMFKNQLQELAQRNGCNLPSYACIREGPDHAPRFKSIVTFDGEPFESPSFFSALRQAEHAAAEVALQALLKREGTSGAVRTLMDETGVCKNLLQETAQRAGVELPHYSTQRSGPGHSPVFTCTVQIGGLYFVGEEAKTKKQAEKNAALAAWAKLKQMAGRSSGTPVEEGEGADEAEQIKIVRVLAQLAALHVRSSPAVLSRNPPNMPAAAVGGGGGKVGGKVPSIHESMLLSSNPTYQPQGSVYVSRQAMAEQQAGGGLGVSGPSYVPRHVKAKWLGAAGGKSEQQQQQQQQQRQQQAANPAANLPEVESWVSSTDEGERQRMGEALRREGFQQVLASQNAISAVGNMQGGGHLHHLHHQHQQQQQQQPAPSQRPFMPMHPAYPPAMMRAAAPRPMFRSNPAAPPPHSEPIVTRSPNHATPGNHPPPSAHSLPLHAGPPTFPYHQPNNYPHAPPDQVSAPVSALRSNLVVRPGMAYQPRALRPANAAAVGGQGGDEREGGSLRSNSLGSSGMRGSGMSEGEGGEGHGGDSRGHGSSAVFKQQGAYGAGSKVQVTRGSADVSDSWEATMEGQHMMSSSQMKRHSPPKSTRGVPLLSSNSMWSNPPMASSPEALPSSSIDGASKRGVPMTPGGTRLASRKEIENRSEDGNDDDFRRDVSGVEVAHQILSHLCL